MTLKKLLGLLLLLSPFVGIFIFGVVEAGLAVTILAFLLAFGISVVVSVGVSLISE